MGLPEGRGGRQQVGRKSRGTRTPPLIALSAPTTLNCWCPANHLGYRLPIHGGDYVGVFRSAGFSSCLPSSWIDQVVNHWCSIGPLFPCLKLFFSLVCPGSRALTSLGLPSIASTHTTERSLSSSNKKHGEGTSLYNECLLAEGFATSGLPANRLCCRSAGRDHDFSSDSHNSSTWAQN